MPPAVVTLTDAFAECCTVPDVPVTVKVVVDAVAVDATARVSVELPPAVTVAGEKVPVTPVGSPETLSAIDCVLPLSGVVDTVYVPLAPCAMVWDAGETATEKFVTTGDARADVKATLTEMAKSLTEDGAQTLIGFVGDPVWSAASRAGQGKKGAPGDERGSVRPGLSNSLRWSIDVRDAGEFECLWDMVEAAERSGSQLSLFLYGGTAQSYEVDRGEQAQEAPITYYRLIRDHGEFPEP